MLSDLTTILTNANLAAVYPDEMPVDSYPAIVYSIIDTQYEQIMGGTLPGSRSRIQLDILSTDHATTDTICNQLKSILLTTHGQTGSTIFVVFRLDDDKSFTKSYQDGSDKILYGRSLDVFAKFFEAG